MASELSNQSSEIEGIIKEFERASKELDHQLNVIMSGIPQPSYGAPRTNRVEEVTQEEVTETEVGVNADENESQAIQHILSNVLVDFTYVLLFDELGVTTMSDFMLLNSQDFKAVEMNHSGRIVRLTPVQVATCNALQRWFTSVADLDADDDTVWFDLNKTALRQFMLSEKREAFTDRSARISPRSADMPSTIHDVHSTFVTETPRLPEILPGVNRSVNEYPKLKEDKMWISYNRALRVLASVHGVAEVLNTQQVIDEESNPLFKIKSTFLYSVFTFTLLTSKSRMLVRKYENTQSGQSVYRELLLAYSHGTAASLSADNLEMEIRNLKLDNTWKKPIETFLHIWSSKVYDLEVIRDAEISDIEKRRWLTNSIKYNQHLFQGINTAKSVEQAIMAMSGTNGRTMTWDRFFGIVVEQAQILDSTMPKKTGQVTKSNQQTTPKNGVKANNTTTANTTNSQRPNGNNQGGTRHADYIPKEKWDKMTLEQKKKIWDKRKKKRAQSGNNNSNNSNNNTGQNANSTNQSTSTSQQTTTVANSQANAANSTPQSTPAHTFLAQGNNQTPNIVLNGITYRATVTRTIYKNQVCNNHNFSLIDRGANGGLTGDDVTVIAMNTMEKVDIEGIGGKRIDSLDIVTAAGYLETTTGPVIGIFHRYAHYGRGNSIHSALQLEDFGHKVIDGEATTKPHGQKIITTDGLVIPLVIRGGLVHMPMRAPTHEEIEQLPHVIMTADVEWDLTKYDSGKYPKSDLPEEVPEIQDEETDLEENVLACLESITLYKPKSRLPSNPDFDKLRPLFGWVPVPRIKDTIKNTTQWYQAEGRLPMRRHLKSRFPGANVPRRNENVATDTVFADTPALDDGLVGHGGVRMVQFFCGCTSEFVAIYPMSSESQVHMALQDFIRFYGAPKNLFSDNAKSQIGLKVQEILRHFTIGHYKSEPHQQNQNPAERRIQDIKRHTNVLLDRTGSPAELWLLCMLYVVDLHNHLASPKIDNHVTPIQKAFGYVPDISKFLQFHWYQ